MSLDETKQSDLDSWIDPHILESKSGSFCTECLVLLKQIPNSIRRFYWIIYSIKTSHSYFKLILTFDKINNYVTFVILRNGGWSLYSEVDLRKLIGNETFVMASKEMVSHCYPKVFNV